MELAKRASGFRIELEGRGEEGGRIRHVKLWDKGGLRINITHVYGEQRTAETGVIADFYTNLGDKMGTGGWDWAVGDFNADPEGDKDFSDFQMKCFGEKHKMIRVCPVWEGKEDVTYIGPSGGEGRLDHLLASKQEGGKSVKMWVRRMAGLKSAHAQLVIGIGGLVRGEGGEPFPKRAFPRRKKVAAGDPGWKIYENKVSKACKLMAAKVAEEKDLGSMWDDISKSLGDIFDQAFGKPEGIRGKTGKGEVDRMAAWSAGSDPAEEWRKKLWDLVVREYGAAIETQGLIEQIF